MNFAARNGHTDIVKYLHNRTKGCSKRAMGHAAQNGHTDIIKYLQENKKLNFN